MYIRGSRKSFTEYCLFLHLYLAFKAPALAGPLGCCCEETADLAGAWDVRDRMVSAVRATKPRPGRNTASITREVFVTVTDRMIARIGRNGPPAMTPKNGWRFHFSIDSEPSAKQVGSYVGVISPQSDGYVSVRSYGSIGLFVYPYVLGSVCV